jgi:hypothetical protein
MQNSLWNCLLYVRELATNLLLPSAEFNQETPIDIPKAAKLKNTIPIYDTSTN